MTEVLSVKIDEDMAKLLEEVAREEGTEKSPAARKLLALGAKQWRVERAIGLVIGGKVSVWKASEIAGTSLREFLEILDGRKIPWVKVPPEELEREIRQMKRKAARNSSSIPPP
jgi:predicted HTH domain antitoxin